MPQENFWYWLTLVVIPLLGLWYLVSNLRARVISGYSFYTIAALLQGVPYFLVVILFVLFPTTGIALFFLAYITNGLGKVWMSLQEQAARQNDLPKWEGWQLKRSKLSKWNRLFL